MCNTFCQRLDIFPVVWGLAYAVGCLQERFEVGYEKQVKISFSFSYGKENKTYIHRYLHRILQWVLWGQSQGTQRHQSSQWPVCEALCRSTIKVKENWHHGRIHPFRFITWKYNSSTSFTCCGLKKPSLNPWSLYVCKVCRPQIAVRRRKMDQTLRSMPVGWVVYLPTASANKKTAQCISATRTDSRRTSFWLRPLLVVSRMLFSC